jgi:A/G-specific adenine glycosylase
MENVSDILLWYEKNFRELPWRVTNDPYKIWLSEIILQQTQVKQGLEYYNKFVLKYPEVTDLARASEEEVLKMWQGLGYYTRARNLHKTARIISDQYQGFFPDSYEVLSKLPGIGDYTASAILSFAFNKAFPALDGNVFRLLSRIYDIDLPINEQKSRPFFKNILDLLIQSADPAGFNNAMMEMGAIICRPDNPACHICPVAVECLARKNGTIKLRPVKSQKVKTRVRHFNYLYIKDGDYFYLVKREGKDIWMNLYQLPLIESATPMDEKGMKNEISLALEPSIPYALGKPQLARHLLTHQTIQAAFWELRFDGRPDFLDGQYKKVNLKNYTKYPIPVLVENFLLSLSH